MGGTIVPFFFFFFSPSFFFNSLNAWDDEMHSVFNCTWNFRIIKWHAAGHFIDCYMFKRI